MLVETDLDEHALQPLEPAQWVDKFGDALFRYAVAKVPSREVAEDLVQETFLAALKARQSFRGESSQQTWFLGILRRKIVDYFRRQARESKLTEAGVDKAIQESMPHRHGIWCHPSLPWPTDPQRVLEQQEFQAVLDDCISQLPSSLAAAFQLREAEGADFQAVCKKLGISSSNLSVRLYRARLSLRRCLEKKWFQS